MYNVKILCTFLSTVINENASSNHRYLHERLCFNTLFTLCLLAFQQRLLPGKSELSIILRKHETLFVYNIIWLYNWIWTTSLISWWQIATKHSTAKSAVREGHKNIFLIVIKTKLHMKKFKYHKAKHDA